jgi:CheY-like chemotaxis protein
VPSNNRAISRVDKTHRSRVVFARCFERITLKSRTEFALVSTGCKTLDSHMTGLLLSTVPAMKSDPGAPLSVLLVDENPNGLAARKLILEEQGFAITTCATAEAAWEIFQRSRFDVVVTDYRFSGMNGGELIRMIRGADSPARVILLSAFIGAIGLNEDNTGADEVILKSSKEVPELLRAVRKLGAQSPRRRPPAGAKSGRSRLILRKSAGGGH